MALKSWIDEINANESDPKSEAPLEQASAPAAESFPGENRADKILFAARDRIIEGGVFYGTPVTRAAEDAVNRTYKAIMNGGKDFSALYIACNQWVEAAKKPPKQMAIETLVGVSGK